MPFKMTKATKIIFLRHADTEKDPNANASLWGLSEKGKAQALLLLDNQDITEIDLIYVSQEQKTYLTVEPVVLNLKKEVLESSNFNEVKRGDKFLSKEEFEEEKKKQLTDLSYHAFNGESCEEALERFKEGVLNITKNNEGETILVVTHGTVLNLYFGSLLNVNIEKLNERWKNTDFCAYGIVVDGEVIKDIVSCKMGV